MWFLGSSWTAPCWVPAWKGAQLGTKSTQTEPWPQPPLPLTGAQRSGASNSPTPGSSLQPGEHSRFQRTALPEAELPFQSQALGSLVSLHPSMSGSVIPALWMGKPGFRIIEGLTAEFQMRSDLTSELSSVWLEHQASKACLSLRSLAPLWRVCW